jgi:hypothetical protein
MDLGGEQGLPAPGLAEDEDCRRRAPGLALVLEEASDLRAERGDARALADQLCERRAARPGTTVG